MILDSSIPTHRHDSYSTGNRQSPSAGNTPGEDGEFSRVKSLPQTAHVVELVVLVLGIRWLFRLLQKPVWPKIFCPVVGRITPWLTANLTATAAADFPRFEFERHGVVLHPIDHQRFE